MATKDKTTKLEATNTDSHVVHTSKNSTKTFLQTLAGSGQLVQLDVDVRHQEPCDQAVWSSLQAFNMITRDSCNPNRLDVATWS